MALPDARRSSCAATARPSASSWSTQDSYRLELENLSDAIRGEAEPLLGVADAMAQARTIEALYESTVSGGQIQL